MKDLVSRTARQALAVLILGPAAVEADLTLVAEANPDPAEPKQMLEVQVSVSTTSSTGALTLQLLWPAELAGTPVVTGEGTCPGGGCETGELLTWNLGALDPDTAITVGFDEFVKGNTADGALIALELELLEGAIQVDTLSLSIEVQSDSPLEVAVDPLPDPVAGGGTLVYELVYGNAGAAGATTAELELPVPAGTQFVSATGGGVLDAGVVSWDLGTLAAGSGGRERATFQVDPLSDGTLLVVDAARLSGDVSLVPAESRAMAVSRVGSSGLALALEINPDPVEPSQLMDSQITVSNLTGSATGALTLRLLWPEELSNVPVVTGGGACDGGGCETGEYLTWVLGMMAADTTIALAFNEMIRGTVDDGALVPLEFELIEAGLPARNSSHTLITRTDSPLELAVDPLPDPVVAGSPVAGGAVLVYEIVYGNRGAASAENAQLELPLPAGTQLVSATGDGVLMEGVVSWELGSLAPGGGGRERATVQVDPLTDGSLLVVDAARLSGDVSLVPQESRAMAVSRVGSSGVELALEVNPDPVAPAQVVDAQVSVGNPTGGVTGALTLRLLWPEELKDTPVVTAAGDCPGGGCETGEYLSWDLGALPAESTMIVSFDEIVKGNIADGALVPLEFELIEDGLPARNSSHTLITRLDSPLEIAVDPLPDPVAGGDPLAGPLAGPMLVYEILYGNTSSFAVESALLELPLPAGVLFVSATDGGEEDGGVVRWNLVSVAPGGGGRERATVEVGALTDGSLLVVDAARLSGDVDLVRRESLAMAVSRVATQALELDLTAAPNPVASAQNLNAEITATNPTGGTTGALTLRLLWPEELRATPIVTGGGDCPGGGCERGEYLLWDLGMLGPGASTTVGFDELVRGTVDDGTLIPLEVELIEDGSPGRSNSQTVLTNPFVDTDNDGEPDVFDEDDDDDGMPDWWEKLFGLDPKDAGDAADDDDLDGLDNLGEFNANSDPLDLDTDDDGIRDGLDRLPTIPSNLCFGNDVVLESITIPAGTIGTCGAPGSVDVRSTVVIESSGFLEVYSPEVSFDNGFGVVASAGMAVISVDPTAPVP